MKPFLTIVTCTYNSEKYLGDCIANIISQNLDRSVYEHIIIDGNSSDETMNILNTYKKNNPKSNIVILQKQPQGVYNAMNEGIKNAQGEYVMFANSDDFLEPDILLSYIDYVNKNKHDVYYGDIRIFSGKKPICITPGKNLGKHRLFGLGFNIAVYHPTTLIKKSLFDELGLYDETKKIASDYGFWLACIQAKKTFTYFPHIIANFRAHLGSITSNPENQSKEWSENFFFRKKYLGWWGYCIQVVSLLFWGLGKAKSYLSNIKI